MNLSKLNTAPLTEKTSEATVFIVDDDPAIRDSLTLMIGQENLTVHSYASAEDFL